jgi:hypothetical protein
MQHRVMRALNEEHEIQAVWCEIAAQMHKQVGIWVPRKDKHCLLLFYVKKS